MSYGWIAYSLLFIFFLVESLFLKPRRERAAFRERVYGFAACVAASDAGGGIMLGDFMDVVDANISRVYKPQEPNDPLYGKSAPEFALLLLDFYARSENLPRLLEYCAAAQRDVERLRIYGNSRSLI